MEAAVRLRENFGLINFNFWGKSGRCPSTWMNWTRLQEEDQVVSLCVRRRMIEYNRRTLWWTEKIWSCTTQRTCCCGRCYTVEERTFALSLYDWVLNSTAEELGLPGIVRWWNWKVRRTDFWKKKNWTNSCRRVPIFVCAAVLKKKKEKRKKNNQKSSGEEFTRIKNQWCVWRKSVIETQW